MNDCTDCKRCNTHFCKTCKVGYNKNKDIYHVNWEQDGKLPDTGERVTFGEGTGMREPKDTYFHLVPISALMALAKHYHDGSIKYGDRNWEKGIAWSTCIDAIFRHVLKYNEHGNQDENHLAAIMWNAAALIEYAKTHPELNDLKWRE